MALLITHSDLVPGTEGREPGVHCLYMRHVSFAYYSKIATAVYQLKVTLQGQEPGYIQHIPNRTARIEL